MTDNNLCIYETPENAIVVNELMIKPTNGGNPADATMEYVELYNTSIYPINLNNWSFVNENNATITIDDELSNKIILNEYYEADIDSYQSGKVEYPLENLSEGIHTITFKVWDVFNNSSESSIEFFVSESEDLIIKHLLMEIMLFRFLAKLLNL